MRHLILALTAMLVMTQAHAVQRSFGDALCFFWDGSDYWATPDGKEGSHNSWRISRTEDPCIVDIWQIIISGASEHKKTTRINVCNMPEADAFTISESDDYRSFVLQAEARLPDGAICELDKGTCPTSWRIWDNRGEVFLKHRLRALDYIRNTFCK